MFPRARRAPVVAVLLTEAGGGDVLDLPRDGGGERRVDRRAVEDAHVEHEGLRGGQQQAALRPRDKKSDHQNSEPKRYQRTGLHGHASPISPISGEDRIRKSSVAKRRNGSSRA